MKPEGKNRGLIYWSPRILSILFILFLAMFSLDVISPDLSIGRLLLNILLHNIPVLILLVVLIVAWKYEIVGAVAFLLAGTLYVILTLVSSSESLPIALSWSLTLSGPAILIGILFLLNWLKKKQTK